jgi:hypothetical protein
MMKKIILLFLFFLLPIGSTALSQQYLIHSWESFESGTLPESIVRFHHSNETTVRPLDLRSPRIPREANTGAAHLECGQYALAFYPTKEANHLSAFTPNSLNRSRLGEKGCALFQADFFLPALEVPIPNISLLAQVIDEDSGKYQFYRFGILAKQNKLFFTFANNTSKPEIYKQQKTDDFQLSRPGWHRFQIIFQGRDQIFCAIDGQMTSFSPITEATHQILNAGIMVTRGERDSSAVADNLSIQWTAEEAPLPLSPWTSQHTEASTPNSSPLESGESVIWLNDPSKAWETVRRQKRPLMIMFYSPNISPYEYTKQIIPNNQEAYNLFNQYVLLSLDANQLNGGKMAEKFKISRLPSFIVLDPQTGKETKRIVVLNNKTTWNDLITSLR